MDFYMIKMSYFCSVTSIYREFFMEEQKKSHTKTLRLIHPQWHGGITDNWMPANLEGGKFEGYHSASVLLKAMMPQDKSSSETVSIPLSREIGSGVGGQNDYDDMLKQTRVVSDIILSHAPEKIVTLAGDSSATVIPLGYLNGYYMKDICVIWIDANPDINVPYTMALMAWLGKLSEDFKRLWPTMVPSSRLLIVGYRAWNQSLKEWQDDLGMKGISPVQAANDSSVILDWIRQTGKNKVFVHLDLSVLDPFELFTSQSRERQGMKMAEAVRVVNDIAETFDLVGITVVEPTPRLVKKVRGMLSQLPLFGDADSQKDETV